MEFKQFISGLVVLILIGGMFWSFDKINALEVLPEFKTIEYEIVCIDGTQYILTESSLVPNLGGIRNNGKLIIKRCKSLK